MSGSEQPISHREMEKPIQDSTPIKEIFDMRQLLYIQ